MYNYPGKTPDAKEETCLESSSRGQRTVPVGTSALVRVSCVHNLNTPSSLLPLVLSSGCSLGLWDLPTFGAPYPQSCQGPWNAWPLPPSSGPTPGHMLPSLSIPLHDVPGSCWLRGSWAAASVTGCVPGEAGPLPQ